MAIITDTTSSVKLYHLYIKTHRVTGLKYLGYTSAKDPHKYVGSGTYWIRHLEKHGFDYETEILLSTSVKSTIKEQGIYYSSLWNIVSSDEWANLKPEEGDGGKLPGIKNPPGTVDKWKHTMLERYGSLNSNTTESIEKSNNTKVKNGTENSWNAPEVKKRSVETRRKNGSYNWTQESRNKITETKTKNGTLNSNTPESIAKGLETKRKNGTLGLQTAESISKQKETLLKRYGTLNRNTPESVAKSNATKARKKLEKLQQLKDI